MKVFFANYALLPQGWAKGVRITVSKETILDIETGLPFSHDQKASDFEPLLKDLLELTLDTKPEIITAPIIIPGMSNLHSHSFQYAMAGLTQHRGTNESESHFWTWRSQMYDFASRLRPRDFHHIAMKLFLDMLKAGYTSVAEFHYVHNNTKGEPYHPTKEFPDISQTHLSEMIIAAAKKVGIAITMLPTFYAHSNFEKPPLKEQKRFITTPKEFLAHLAILQERYKADPNVVIGMAFHSLRAVSEAEMLTILQDPLVKEGNFPIHIHIAEQEKEVEDCLEIRKKRPVEWLLETIIRKNYVSPHRWVLVHATHITEKEAEALAKSGVTVCFCPTTERDLGDGIAPVHLYHKHGGRFCIGSDSNTVVNPFTELKDLELDQRALLKRRNVLTKNNEEVSKHLYLQSLYGGSIALGRKANGLEIGNKADMLFLNHEHPSIKPFIHNNIEKILSIITFRDFFPDLIKKVIVSGKIVIENAKLVNSITQTNEETIIRNYDSTMDFLNKPDQELNPNYAPVDPSGIPISNVIVSKSIIRAMNSIQSLKQQTADSSNTYRTAINALIQALYALQRPIPHEALKGLVKISNDNEVTLPLLNELDPETKCNSLFKLLTSVGGLEKEDISIKESRIFITRENANIVKDKLKSYFMSNELEVSR